MSVEQNDDVEMSIEGARNVRDEEEFTRDASRPNATQDADVDFTELDLEPETGFSKETEDLFGPDSDEEISISDAAAAPEPSPNDNNRSVVSSEFDLNSFSNATVNELSTEMDMDAQLDADLNATWDAIIGTGNDDASSESSQTITPGSQSQFEVSLEVDLDVDMGPTREGHFEAENDTNSQSSEMFIPEHSQSQSASSPEPDVEADLHKDTEMPTQNIEQERAFTNTTTNNVAEPAPEAAPERHWDLPPQNLPIYFVVKKASGSIKRFGPIDLLISPSEMKFGSLMTKARHFIEQGDPKQSENFDLESQNYDVREFLKEEGVRFEGNWWREMGLSVVWVGRSNDGEDGVLSLIKSDVEFGKVCRTVTLGWGVRWVVQFEVV